MRYRGRSPESSNVGLGMCPPRPYRRTMNLTALLATPYDGGSSFGHFRWEQRPHGRTANLSWVVVTPARAWFFEFRIPHSTFKKTPSRAHYERTPVYSDAVRRFLFFALAGFVPKRNDFAVALRGGRRFRLFTEVI